MSAPSSLAVEVGETPRPKLHYLLESELQALEQSSDGWASQFFFFFASIIVSSFFGICSAPEVEGGYSAQYLVSASGLSAGVVACTILGFTWNREKGRREKAAEGIRARSKSASPPSSPTVVNGGELPTGQAPEFPTLGEQMSSIPTSRLNQLEVLAEAMGIDEPDTKAERTETGTQSTADVSPPDSEGS